MFSRRPATQRAAQQLITDPQRSDLALAELASVSFTTIARVRFRLESLAIIPVIPPAGRLARPRPQQPSATAEAIAVLGPDASPREIADAASVSLQAAWKALRRLNPSQQDCAAAVDALSVVSDAPQLQDAAAASDAISVQAEITCANCSAPFTVSARNARRRFCTPDCADAAAIAQGRKPPARRSDSAHPPPQIQPLPPMPDEIILGGLCVQPDLKPEHRYVWTSDAPEDREIARRYCRACSVRQVCYGWSLHLPVHDPAIYAGMSQVQRLKAKRLAAIPKPSPRNLRLAQRQWDDRPVDHRLA